MIDEEIKKAYSKVTKQCETKSDRVSYKDAKNSFRAMREENEMEFSGVYHKTSEQMSYALDEDRLIVNIKTGYDVKQVFIHYGDPYEAGILGGKEKWIGKREEMIYKKRLPYQIWWTTTLLPEYKRCKYYFELRTEKEVWYYFEDGFLTEEQLRMDGRMQQCFIVPWMNPADINRTPAWVNETIWYQIFPDRFCNGTPEKNGDDITPWRNHGTVTNEEKFGGNLEGIRQRLSYLQELGITGIYLNPIMKAESNHKYDTTDYTKIDPSFGDADTMKALCKEAHEKGIRIMVDAVFNHSGRKFEPWIDILEHGKESRYADWFMVEDWEQVQKRGDTRDRRFYSFAFTDGMPKLNTNNEEVIQYFCKICEDWVREFDIDGIRFDVGNEVSHRFLKRIREHLKTIKPDIYLLGEIWHDASQWLQGDEYDSVMNYPLLSGIHDFFLDKTMKKEEFEYMKLHTVKGCELIQAVNLEQSEELKQICYDIIRYHHERYDGKGYPDGLKGDEIPVSAQLVSLADVYDALINERCYKDAFSNEKAFNMIMNGECGTFSPKLLETFKQVRDKFERFAIEERK